MKVLKEQKIQESGSHDTGVGIYVHIPFCVRKCLYCDFLSAPAGEERIREYAKALVREIRESGENGTKADTIFVGGGTPSIIEPSLLDSIFEELYRTFRVSPEAEISIEANPGTLSDEKLKAYRQMGINRLSIGLQSANDEELRRLGRIHTFRDFLHSYSLARKAGFDNINIDLMFALPGQSRESWQKTLHIAANAEPEHISAYSLIIEEGTPFAQMHLDLPDEDKEYQMYDDTAAILSEYGYSRYEISNYAKPGRRCLHNLSYWTCKDYLGFGLGASSLRRCTRYRITDDMDKYLARSGGYRNPDEKEKYLTGSSASPGITNDRYSCPAGTGTIKKNADETGQYSGPGSREALIEDRQILSLQDRMAEYMFLGLRLTEDGVSRAEFMDRFGVPMDDIYREPIEKYKNCGLLLEENGRIFLSRHGIHVSNTIMADFL